MIPLGFFASSAKTYASWSKSTAPATVVCNAIQYAPLTAGNWFMFHTGSAGAAGTAYRYSTNGTSWTSGTLPASKIWGTAAFNGTTLVIYPDRTGSAGDCYTTTNGTTWTSRTIAATTTEARIKYLNGRFWWMGSPTSMYHSTDGATWTAVANGSASDMDFLDGTFISTAGRRCTGDPTVAGNWGTITLPTISSNTPFTIAGGNGVWVLGYGGSTPTTTYYYSGNGGTSWTAGTLPVSLGTFSGINQSGNNTRIHFANGAFYYAVNNDVYYSTDGINWTTVSTGTGLTFRSRSISESGTLALIVGNGGTGATNTTTYLSGV